MVNWTNTFKNNPQDTDDPSNTGQYLRETRAGVEERVAVDHEFVGAVGGDTGKHKQVSFIEKTAEQAGNAEAGTVYTREGTLYFKDGDGNEIDISTPVVISQQVPTGAILDFAGSTAPDGYLLCDGSAYSTTIYAALFAVIGNTYGSEGGLFRVPDYTSRFSRGTSASDSLGDTGGNAEHTLSIEQMPRHTHAVEASAHGGNDIPSAVSVYQRSTPPPETSPVNPSHAGWTLYTGGEAGGGAGNASPFSTLPPYLAVNKIIKT